MKELKQRLKYFAETLKDHKEYVDYNSTGHLEQSSIRTKEQTMNEIGDMLLEILELDNKTFQSWLAQEEDGYNTDPNLTMHIDDEEWEREVNK